MGEHEQEMNQSLNPDRFVGWVQRLFPNLTGDTIVAWIRTVVPVFIGTVLSSLIKSQPDVASWLDDFYPGWTIAVGSAITGLTIALYYTAARWIEKRWPKTGALLLGSKKQPVYVNPVG